jgi:hypothetical protein
MAIMISNNFSRRSLARTAGNVLVGSVVSTLGAAPAGARESGTFRRSYTAAVAAPVEDSEL